MKMHGFLQRQLIKRAKEYENTDSSDEKSRGLFHKTRDLFFRTLWVHTMTVRPRGGGGLPYDMDGDARRLA